MYSLLINKSRKSATENIHLIKENVKWQILKVKIISENIKAEIIQELKSIDVPMD